LLPDEGGELPDALRDVPVVVVYLFQTQSAGVWKPAETMGPGGPYLPLRCGRLVQAFKDGGIAHFFFELSGYVNAEGNSAREKLNSDVKFRVNASARERSSYAHISQELGFNSSKDQDTVSFQSIVDVGYLPGEWRTRSLGRVPLDVTYDIVFFRVTGFLREQNSSLTELIPSRRFVQGSVSAEYQLEPGATYHLRLVTHLASRLPALLPGEGRARLKLKSDRKVFTPLGPIGLRISSLYDLEYWSFVVETAQSGRCALRVVCEYEAPRNREDFVRRELLCPEISLPISIVAPGS
jgi:hypothetical protein